MKNTSLLTLVVLSAGCIGEIAGDDTSPPLPPDIAGIERPAPDDPATDPAAPLEPFRGGAPVALRRLTTSQYRNTIRDLLGPNFTIPTVEAEPALEGFTSVGASQVSTSRVGVEQFELGALSLAAQWFTDPGRYGRVVPCAPSGALDAACARSAIVWFGRVAFRRPLTDAEVTRYLVLWDGGARATSNFHRGIEQVLAGMMQSPKFLYRTEYGQPAGSGTRRYTGYDTAARLSFVLWNTTPDAQLLDAAGAGELDRREGVRAHAARLAGSSRARTGLRAFFADLMNLGELGDPGSEGVPRPEVGGAVPGPLAAAMREEVLRNWESATFDERLDVSELLRSRSTFVNRSLAQHYGLPATAATGYERITLPETSPRAGMLTRGALLVRGTSGTESSPVRRGKFARERLLCQPVPAPPGDVNTMLDPVDPNKPHTARQRLERHATDGGCRSCHRAMDPIGLALENFDATGRFRSTDHGLTIDPSGDLDGQPFRDAAQLGERLAQHEALGPCLVTSFYRHATGQTVRTQEQVVVDRLSERFNGSGRKLRDLVLDLITSEVFLHATGPL